MTEQISTDTARIHALEKSIVSLLQDEDSVSPDRVEKGAALLAESFQAVLNLGSKILVDASAADIGAALRTIEAAHMDWRRVDAAFRRLLDQAFNGNAPRETLLLDNIHNDLRRQIGEPVAALSARVRAEWEEHLARAPWDAYVAEDAPDPNAVDLNTNLKSLMHGDHLDVEDAVEGLTGPLRYTFSRYLETRNESVDVLEESLWMRPEIVVVNDYWRMQPTVRILEMLGRKASKFASAFAQVQDFFSSGNTGGAAGTSDRVVNDIKALPAGQKDAYYRCLMVHPDQSVRRYALSNVELEGFWKVATPKALPCATILTMLEKVAAPGGYPEDFQKIFFRTVYRRLLSLSSCSDVIYARGIVRILMTLPFFMEDEYFNKLMTLTDYVAAKQKHYKIEDGILDGYVRDLREEKDKIGTLQAQSPSLTSIPPVVLRKLARDGHLWHELAMHPMYKVARETIPHINSPDRALRIANNHMVNQDVLRVVGKSRALFSTLPSKMALLANPRTPPTVSLAYVTDLTKTDTEQLLRRSTVHPELRTYLRKRLNA